MAQLGELAGVTAASGTGALTAAGANRAATLGPLNLVATLHGANILAEHFYAMAAIYGPVVQQLTHYFGALMAEYAKAIHMPHIKTQATYDSIKSEPIPMVGAAGVGAGVQVSVATPQAQFLEFGFVHWRSGQFIHYPFMIPAADAVAPMLVDALGQFMQIASWRKFFTGPAADAGGNDILGSIRGSLYSYSKFAGDVQVLGFGGLSKSRGFAIKGAKGIGTIQAAQHGTMLARMVRIGAGRFGGSQLRGANFGSGFSSGATGRIYNRLSGRAFGSTLSGIRL